MTKIKDEPIRSKIERTIFLTNRQKRFVSVIVNRNKILFSLVIHSTTFMMRTIPGFILQSFVHGGFGPRENPLTPYTTEKVPPSYSLKKVSYSHTFKTGRMNFHVVPNE